MADISGASVQSPGPARVYAARFDTLGDADAVRSELQALGYDPREISSISDPEKCSFTLDSAGSHVPRGAAQGVVGGAALGGGVSAAFGALGLGSLAVLGPAGVIIGAAIGGFAGALLRAGLDSDQALACQKAVNEGSLVMAVQAHTGDDTRIRDLLGDRVIATEDDMYR